MLSDQGKEFESELMKAVYQLMGVDKIRTSSYKPSTNGAVERFHRTLNSVIAKVVNTNQRDWDECLPYVLAAYRATPHSSTGFSPNFLLFGREIRAPIDVVLGTPGDKHDFCPVCRVGYGV